MEIGILYCLNECKGGKHLPEIQNQGSMNHSLYYFVDVIAPVGN